ISSSRRTAFRQWWASHMSQTMTAVFALRHASSLDVTVYFPSASTRERRVSLNAASPAWHADATAMTNNNANRMGSPLLLLDDHLEVARLAAVVGPGADDAALLDQLAGVVADEPARPVLPEHDDRRAAGGDLAGDPVVGRVARFVGGQVAGDPVVPDRELPPDGVARLAGHLAIEFGVVAHHPDGPGRKK